MWLSLVERCVRDAEVAGSNPVTSTFYLPIKSSDFIGFLVFWFGLFSPCFYIGKVLFIYPPEDEPYKFFRANYKIVCTNYRNFVIIKIGIILVSLLTIGCFCVIISINKLNAMIGLKVSDNVLSRKPLVDVKRQYPEC